MTKTKQVVSLQVEATPKIEGEVRKANEAIAIRPMTGESLTFLTRKIYNTMLFHAQKQGVDKKRYRLALRTITHGADFNSNDIGLVKEHLKKMRRTEIEWNDPGKEWGIASLVSEAVIKKESDELILEWEYPSSIHQRLLSPTQYTPIALAHQALMRTHAGLALLEICLRYETFVGGQTERKPWEWWYPALTGNVESKARTSRQYFYRYFKRDTIKPAIAEVNSLTDFNVELVEHTRGRKVLDIQFRIHKKKQATLDLEQQMFDVSLISRMISIGLKESEAQKIYSATEENRVRAALDATEKKMRSRSKPDSPVAYFKAALGSDWLIAKEQVPDAKRIEVKKPDADFTPSPQILAALAMFDALAQEQQAELLRALSTEHPYLAEKVRTAPGSPLVRKILGPWLAKKS